MGVSVGDTFIARYPEDKQHLFFVIFDVADRCPELYICAMLSSWKEGSRFCDSACIIVEGEHPFVRHKSYIAYAETMILTRDDMERLIEEKKFIAKEPASPELIKRIRESSLKSKNLNDAIRNYIMHSLLH